jgi:hypothetical protein
VLTFNLLFCGFATTKFTNHNFTYNAYAEKTKGSNLHSSPVKPPGNSIHNCLAINQAADSSKNDG